METRCCAYSYPVCPFLNTSITVSDPSGLNMSEWQESGVNTVKETWCRWFYPYVTASHFRALIPGTAKLKKEMLN